MRVLVCMVLSVIQLGYGSGAEVAIPLSAVS